MLVLSLVIILAACNGKDSGTVILPPVTNPPVVKSAKRGIAYDLISPADYAALAPGVGWWYDWTDQPHGGAVAELRDRYSMDFIPMLWNQNFNDAQITQMLQSNPQVRYLLALNEPNLNGQATRTPQQAADLWTRIEKIAKDTGVKIVGPQITWGNLAGYEDPVVWMDAFYAAYRTANGGRDPQIDYLGFHWYDYGLKAQLERLTKYGKPFWVTEMANWHVGDGNAAIDSLEKQMAQMTEMVKLCEDRADVFRYAWFTGRGGTDLNNRFTTLLAADGALTALGRHYLSLPSSTLPQSQAATQPRAIMPTR
jgi:Glycosyl hydrolase catalytic core